MTKSVYAILAIALALCGAHTSRANDSSAEIGLSGLQLTQNDVISMDSEDLYLSPDLVRVRYEYTNTGDRDVELLISFPLPAIPGGIDGHMGDRGYPDWNDLKFVTLIDGEVVPFDTRVIAVTDSGKDITAVLTQMGWPLAHWQQENEMGARIAALDTSERTRLTDLGILKISSWGELIPAWSQQTHITRKQVFPAGKTVKVEHRYKPLTGQSISGAIGAAVAGDRYNELDYYERRYCIDKDFRAGFAARQQALGDKQHQYYETNLGYILSTGANWKGPIKDFRLVVDKGKAGNFVSLCMDGVRKISPTRFEVRKTNYEPARDLDVLFIIWVGVD